MGDHEMWQALVRHAVCHGAEALLHGAVGPLDLANMAVDGDNVDFNGPHGSAHAFELLIAMDVAHGKTARLVAANDVAQLAQDGGTGTVGEGGVTSAETDDTGDGMEIRKSLYKEEIGT